VTTPPRVPPGLRAFGHRDFRLFWGAQLVSLVGTWMQSVAQAWLVLTLTPSPFLVGLVSALQFTPVLLLSFPAGVIADRFPKRRLMLLSQSVLCVQASALAVLVGTGHVAYWHVAVLATLYGLGNTLDMPTRQSFMIELVGKDDLMNAIALNSAMFNSARVIGPAVAGLVIDRWGTTPAFVLNALSFVPVFAALLSLHAEGAPSPASRRGMGAQIAEGVRYAVRTPRITLVLALVLTASAFFMNYNVVVPLLVRDVLRAGPHEFGLLMTALGIGAVAGAITLAVRGRGRPRVVVLLAAAALLGSATVALSGAVRFGAAAVLLTLMGFCGISLMAGANTTLQLTVPDGLRGRVMSLYALVFAGMTPFGALLVGTLAEGFGVRAALAVVGSTGLLAVLALGGWWRRRPESG
jgi:MFS family permease